MGKQAEGNGARRRQRWAFTEDRAHEGVFALRAYQPPPRSVYQPPALPK